MNAKPESFRTVPADEFVRRGRLTKARRFFDVADDALQLADDATDVADAATTLYVHAGIAAADAICAKALQKHAKGQDHNQAVTLLETIDREASKNLRILLQMKTRAAYGHDPVGADQLRRARRAARSLLDKALLLS